MKRLIVVVLLVLVVAATYRFFGSAETGTGTLTLEQPAPNVDEQAPTFTVKNVEGESFVLSDEGVYVLTFWSTLNENSNDAQPGFARLAREYEDDGAAFAVVYVNSAPRNEDVPYAMLQDGTGKLTSPGMYNVKRVPRLFLVKDGVIELVLNNFYEGYEKDLEKALEGALADKS